MRVKFLIVILLFVSNLSFSKELSDFEKMLSGFPECKFNEFFLDEKTGEPIHEFLKRRNLKPKEMDFGVYAVYELNEIFYGLRVSKLIIDSQLQTIVGIDIEGKKFMVEKNLHDFLIYGYNKDPYKKIINLLWFLI